MVQFWRGGGGCRVLSAPLAGVEDEFAKAVSWRLPPSGLRALVPSLDELASAVRLTWSSTASSPSHAKDAEGGAEAAATAMADALIEPALRGTGGVKPNMCPCRTGCRRFSSAVTQVSPPFAPAALGASSWSLCAGMPPLSS